MSTSDLHTTVSDPFEKFYYAITAADNEEEGEDLHDYYGYEGPFKYKTEDFISRPTFSPKSDIEENILEFDCSYGYDCKKPYNLVVIDEQTLIFASGNLIHFYDVTNNEIWYRRSAKGGGIGHITNNPAFPHFAVGENGKNPIIIIYQWPSLEIVCVLKGGTGTSSLYTHLNYSPNGDLLVSQGGEPDYKITVWDWGKATILLRTRSYMNDVLRVMFSPYVPGHLTSSGVAHIKFWKIAKTFTGLKLQGNLGRFGKTEYSDIVGIYPMADEKVISGCHWGNILVWEEGLIKLEVCRKNRKRCHDDAIVQFNYDHGELWTVSLDGHVKMWFYDTIDQADPPDEDRFCMMEPTYDFHTPGARYMSIVKQYQDPENTFYFAQDAKGGIWRIDLNIEDEAAPSERLLKSHAGVTKGLAVCPWGPYFTTIGIGGWVHLYNYLTRKLLTVSLFSSSGSHILWMPMEYDLSGEVVIAGFGDGTVRVCIWKIDEEIPSNCKMHVLQIAKVHNKTLTVFSLNNDCSLLVSGAEDHTIFVQQVVYEKLRYPRLVPIGYIPLTETPSCMVWHNTEPNTVIVGCEHGQIYIVDLPIRPQPYTKISFELVDTPISQRFHTYKSQIYRDILLKELQAKKQAKREKKMENLKKIQHDNPGLDMDEELFLQDSESEEELPPLYIPEEPNKIYWIQHTPDDTLWVSMAGYDAGFIYEYKLGQSDPVPHKFFSIPGAESNDVANYVYSPNKEYLFFAMIDGAIRVNRVNPNDWHDLSNYWSLPMHDNYNGYIPGFQFSYDYEFFLTSGNDGNVFVFKFNTDEPKPDLNLPPRQIPELGLYKLYDNVNCNNIPSLEEMIVNQEADRLNKVANENKQTYLSKIVKLRERYEKVLLENETLPPSQKLTTEELCVDQRVDDDLNRVLNDEEALVRRKFEFNVEKARVRMVKLKRHFIDSVDVYPLKVKSIRTNREVRTFKQHCLGDDFYELLDTVELKIQAAEMKGRQAPRTQAGPQREPTPPIEEQKLEYFLVGLSPEIIENKLGPQINRILRKYRTRKAWKENRKREWDIYNALMPTDIAGDEDVNTIQEAEDSIGDFKLKSAPDYKVPKLYRETTFTKYKQLLLVREKYYNLVHGVNLKVYELREEKYELHELLIRYKNRLDLILDELLIEDQKTPPEVFELTEEDYPERFLEIRVTMMDYMPKDADEIKFPLVHMNEDQLQRAILLESGPDEDEEEHLTEWERHFHEVRYRTKRYEQDRIIRRMITAIDHFDMIHDRIRYDILRKRIEVDVMHSHLLLLHQEMLILKDCEEKEDQLTDNVNVKHNELLDVQDENAEITVYLDNLKKEMDKLLDKEKEINKSFYTSVAENKFFDFLKRIFKKKYKPPKIPNPDDDSESSSSSSSSDESEEEDAASIDSKDFGIIRLDESVCPKGCDPAIYELTFQLRGQRHEIEQKYRDCTMDQEIKIKQKEQFAKRMRIIDNELQKRKEELELYQREKQQKLNQIICTVIMKLSQLKHIKPEGGLNNIRNSLVMSQNTLSKLYQRVGVLDKERREQREKHTLSVVHLKRMENDFKVMEKTKKDLRAETVELMQIKFGSKVNIQELEEYVLKRMIFDLRLSLSDIKGMFDAEMAHLYEVYKHSQKDMMKWLKNNTSAQDLLCMLKMEKADLERTQEHQQKVILRMPHLYDEANKMKDELIKLDKVIKYQAADIDQLKKEIKTYRTKGLVLPAPKVLAPIVISQEEICDDESEIQQWSEIDDYMYTEAYAKEYWANRQIQEARKTRREVIYGIMDDLFKNIDLQLQHNRVVALLKSVISDVMNKCDVKEIIDDILKVIPYPERLTDEQTSLIELTAEKLYTVDEFDLEPTAEEEETEEQRMIREQTTQQIHEIAVSVLEDTKGDPTKIITELVEKVLDSVPLHVVLEDHYMDVILGRMATAIPQIQSLDKNIMDNVQLKSLESNILMAECLDRVFQDVHTEFDQDQE